MIQEDSIYRSLVYRFGQGKYGIPRHMVLSEKNVRKNDVKLLTSIYPYYNYDFSCFSKFQIRFINNSSVSANSVFFVNGRPFVGKTVCAELFIDSHCYVSKRNIISRNNKVIYLSPIISYPVISERLRNRFDNGMVYFLNSHRLNYDMLYECPVIITRNDIFDDILRRCFLTEKLDWVKNLSAVIFDDFVFDTKNKFIIKMLKKTSKKVSYIFLPIGRASDELEELMESYGKVNSFQVDSEWPVVSTRRSGKSKVVRSDYVDYVKNGGVYLDSFIRRSAFERSIYLECKDPFDYILLSKAFGRAEKVGIKSSYYKDVVSILNGDYRHDDREENFQLLFDSYLGKSVSSSYLSVNGSVDNDGKITYLGRISVASSVYPDDLKAWVDNFDLIIKEGRIDDLSISWALCSVPSFEFPSDLSFDCPNLDKKYSMAVWSLWKFFTTKTADRKKLPYDIRPFVRKARLLIDCFSTAMSLVDNSITEWRKDYLWESVRMMVLLGKNYDLSKVIALDPNMRSLYAKRLISEGLDSHYKIANSNIGKVTFYKKAYSNANRYAFLEKFRLGKSDLDRLIQEVLL